MQKITLTEFVDKQYAAWLLRNIEQNKINLRSSVFIEDSKEYTAEYCKKIIDSKTGTIRVTYKQKNGQGRYYANGFNLQKLPRDARHTLCNLTYYDIDIVNSQPTIFYQYFTKNDINCPKLKIYFEHRDDIIKDIMNKYQITKDEAKMIFISVLNGGGKPTYTDKFINDFFDEIKVIRNTISNLKENEKLVNEAKNENKKNLNGSVMCLRYQIIENEILQCAHEFFSQHNFQVNVSVFDGLMIRKTKELSEELLDELNDHVFNTTGYEVQFIVKPMNEGYDVSDDELTKINETNDHNETRNSDNETNDDGGENIVRVTKNKITAEEVRKPVKISFSAINYTILYYYFKRSGYIATYAKEIFQNSY